MVIRVFEPWGKAGRKTNQRLGWNPGQEELSRRSKGHRPFVIRALPHSKIKYSVSIA